MVWIIAFVCLGLVAGAGYYQGPIRAGFSFFGLLFGSFLAGPLSPLTQRLLIMCGLHHPAWDIFAPQVLAFLIVLTIFKIAGHMVHRKVAVHFKYKVDEKTIYRWQRVYSRLGLCVGFLNGAVYFILLTLLMYSAGYFTTVAASGANDPAGVRFLTDVRAGLHAQNMDKVLASYDMVPPKVYEAADTVLLVLQNPLLLSRLGHYPSCLQLAQRPDFQQLGHDVQFLQMLTSRPSISEVLQNPQVHSMATNATVVADVSHILSADLDDLTNFLVTGQSAKYDSEIILGFWDINRAATIAKVREKQPNITPQQLKKKEDELTPLITGLSLTATPDKQMIMKELNMGSGENKVVSAGTWTEDHGAYQVNLPGSLPETSTINIDNGTRLFLQSRGYVLAFDKEL